MSTQKFIEDYLMSYPGDIPEEIIKTCIDEFQIISTLNNPDFMDEWLISFPNRLKKLMGE